MKTTGDGVLALFDGSERAVRAAAAMCVAAKSLGLAIRAGIHTGEVELAAGDVRGLSVHIAARIMALAGPNEVYVSGTTRELVGDSDLSFVDAGIHGPGPDFPERCEGGGGTTAAHFRLELARSIRMLRVV